ncbi:TPR [Bugula neritina]|uniref:TPR n=1 Tax=Bugula neritina TaxID=10212 RepID=A0A7J7JR98_BUGNE|nr:TPR [Bugula neritina]
MFQILFDVKSCLFIFMQYRAQARASPLRSTTEVDSEKLRSLKEELKTSKDSLEKVNREFQAYRKEQRDEERKLSNELEEVKKERTEIKLNNAKLTTQLDYSMESSKVIEKNVVAYKQEISALRTKAEQYSNLVAKNESLVENLRADLSRAQESSVKFDVANQQAKNEVEMLKAVNRRLQVEADTAKKDYNLQLQMLSNLQSIQTSIESSNVEMKAHYQHRLEQSLSDNQALEKQIVSLKEDMKTVESHQAAEVTSWKEKVESLNQQLASSQEKLLKAIDEQKHHRQTSAARVGGDDSDAAAAQSGDSQDLRHAKSEIEALKDQLRLSGEASDEYRVAADRLELTLRELTAVSQQTQETLERKVAQQQAEMEEQAGKLKC